VAEAARSLGIHPTLLRAWKQDLQALGGQAFPGPGNPPAVGEELRRLRAENKKTPARGRGRPPAGSRNRGPRWVPVHEKGRPTETRTVIASFDSSGTGLAQCRFRSTAIAFPSARTVPLGTESCSTGRPGRTSAAGNGAEHEAPPLARNASACQPNSTCFRAFRPKSVPPVPLGCRSVRRVDRVVRRWYARRVALQS
jgi:hypothetical protein